MAFINKETVSKIRKEINAAFPRKDGWCISLRGSNSPNLGIRIYAAPIRFSPDAVEYNQYFPERTEEYMGISKQAADVVRAIDGIVRKYHWDNSNAQIDYFRCAFYYSIVSDITYNRED